MVLPTQLWLIHHPSLCTDEWRSTTCTLIPSVFLTKKKEQEVSSNEAQRGPAKKTPQQQCS